MKLTVKCKVDIEVPDKATHYVGDIFNDPDYYHMSVIAEVEYWWVWRFPDTTCGTHGSIKLKDWYQGRLPEDAKLISSLEVVT